MQKCDEFKDLTQYAMRQSSSEKCMHDAKPVCQ